MLTPPPPPARRGPVRFAEVTPPMVAEVLGNSRQAVPEAPPAPMPWEDVSDLEPEYAHDPREQTQPMFQLAALVAAGAMPATLAPAAMPPPAAPPVPLAAELAPAAPRAEAVPQIPSRPGVDYDALFERATRAYVRRSYDEAMTLFEEYLAKRPDDRRALHNLEQLRKRRKGS
jgi:TolA-binding protein